MFDSLDKRDDSMLISYNQLRMIIGLLGIALPIGLLIQNSVVGHCTESLCSISHNYYSAGRDWFVAILSVVAFFMYAYRGYNDTDRILSKMASLFVIGIISFPTNSSSCPGDCIIYASEDDNIRNALHFISAGLFFVILIVFCLRQFVQSDPNKEMSEQKKRRNRIYRICGIIMTLCLIVMGIDAGFKGDAQYFIHEDVFFYAESIALFAFGISWLTKAEIFYPDNKEPPEERSLQRLETLI